MGVRGAVRIRRGGGDVPVTTAEWDAHKRMYCICCEFRRLCPVVNVMRIQLNDQTARAILRDGKCTQFKEDEK